MDCGQWSGSTGATLPERGGECAWRSHAGSARAGCLVAAVGTRGRTWCRAVAALGRGFGLGWSRESCFTDRRDSDWIEFSAEQLVRQRVFGLALGYEDRNDHDPIRHDPLLGLAVSRHDVHGGERRNQARDAGKALAGKSPLNRIERSVDATSRNGRYHKVFVDTAACDRLLVDLFLKQQTKAPRWVVIDVAASDIPLHGDQLGRSYHGHYNHYC